jgi:hypothetical protein
MKTELLRSKIEFLRGEKETGWGKKSSQGYYLSICCIIIIMVLGVGPCITNCHFFVLPVFKHAFEQLIATKENLRVRKFIIFSWKFYATAHHSYGLDKYFIYTHHIF